MQTVRTVETSPPSPAAVAASDFLTRFGVSVVAKAAPPAARPELRKKSRRLTVAPLKEAAFDGEPSVLGAGDPVMSRDGSALAFVSIDTGLVGLPLLERRAGPEKDAARIQATRTAAGAIFEEQRCLPRNASWYVN